jgi:hypothetical protein
MVPGVMLSSMASRDSVSLFVAAAQG